MDISTRKNVVQRVGFEPTRREPVVLKTTTLVQLGHLCYNNLYYLTFKPINIYSLNIMSGRGRGQGQAQSRARFSTVIHTNSGRRHTGALRNGKNTRGRPEASSYGYSSKRRHGPVHEEAGQSYYQTRQEQQHAKYNRQFNRNRNFGNGIGGGSNTRKNRSRKSRKSRKSRR